MIKAILFDLDGVLCDLVNVHGNAFNAALSKTCNYTINDYEFCKYYNGIPSKTKLSILINRGILNPNEVQHVWELKQGLTVEKIKEQLKPDIEKIELHKKLKSKNLTLACVSNSIRQTIDLALQSTGQLEYMDLILSNENFGNKPKPNSFCYNLAIDFLFLDKNEVLIVEDSEKGIMAARGSGAHVLEVKDSTEVNILNIMGTLERLDGK